MNDLGLDSLDHVEVVMAMEDEFGKLFSTALTFYIIGEKNKVLFKFEEILYNCCILSKEPSKDIHLKMSINLTAVAVHFGWVLNCDGKISFALIT